MALVIAAVTWHWGIYRAGLIYRACDLKNPSGYMQTDPTDVTCPECLAIIQAGTAA